MNTPASPHEQLLPAYLKDRDVSCPGCHYNLRGLTGEHCPECHQALQLQVGLVEPRLGLWIGGLVGLAAGVGFSGLLLLYVALMTMLERRFGIPASFAITTASGLIVEGLAMSWWIRSRRRFRRWPGGMRGLAVVGCWVLTLANLVIFTILLK